MCFKRKTVYIVFKFLLFRKLHERIRAVAGSYNGYYLPLQF